MTDSNANRLASLDQFRGYTVAGMFLVNFVGGYLACLPVLGHHNTYCSYADTIMPQFFFAVGFAFRLTFGRRIRQGSAAAAYSRVVRRLLGLGLVSLVIYSVDPVSSEWKLLAEQGVLESLRRPLKSDWFQTLMHIAVTSLWILPVIRSSPAIRLLFMLGSAIAHVVVSAWFYFEWVYAPPSAIDGGPLGFLSWSLPMLWGTLACDWIVSGMETRRSEPPTVSAPTATAATEPAATGCTQWLRLTVCSLLLMLAGWCLSCGSRMYDVLDEQPPPSATDPRIAASPVWFSFTELRQRSWQQLIVEPPLVPPPGSRAVSQWEQMRDGVRPLNRWLMEPAPPRLPDVSHTFRRWNYWMMNQKSGSISYHLFGAGLSGFLFVLFYGICDRLGWTLGVFRTLGANALAGYILHMWVQEAVSPFVPRDAPGWYLMSAFGVYFFITWLLLRMLEKQGVYIKV